MNGTVKSCMEVKGYGFIKGTDGKEYFFHQSCCIVPMSSLTPGKKVEFEVVSSPKGPRAEDVNLV